MRVQQWVGPLGLEQGTSLMFSEREKVTLAAAGRIADRARERGRALLGPDFEDHPWDMVLAEIEHGCRDLVEADGIVLDYTVAP